MSETNKELIAHRKAIIVMAAFLLISGSTMATEEKCPFAALGIQAPFLETAHRLARFEKEIHDESKSEGAKTLLNNTFEAKVAEFHNKLKNAGIIVDEDQLKEVLRSAEKPEPLASPHSEEESERRKLKESHPDQAPRYGGSFQNRNSAIAQTSQSLDQDPLIKSLGKIPVKGDLSHSTPSWSDEGQIALLTDDPWTFGKGHLQLFQWDDNHQKLSHLHTESIGSSPYNTEQRVPAWGPNNLIALRGLIWRANGKDLEKIPFKAPATAGGHWEWGYDRRLATGRPLHIFRANETEPSILPSDEFPIPGNDHSLIAWGPKEWLAVTTRHGEMISLYHLDSTGTKLVPSGSQALPINYDHEKIQYPPAWNSMGYLVVATGYDLHILKPDLSGEIQAVDQYKLPSSLLIRTPPAWGPDGSVAVGSSRGIHVIKIDPNSGKIELSVTAEIDSESRSLSWGPGGILTSTDLKGRLHFWRLEPRTATLRHIQTFDIGVGPIDGSPAWWTNGLVAVATANQKEAFSEKKGYLHVFQVSLPKEKP